MPSDIAGLVNNISQSVTDFINPKDPGANLYPKSGLFSVLAQVEKSNWNKSFPYTFSVQTDTGADLIQSSAGTATETFSDFPLPINPTDLTQDENFSIVLRPTQGGTVVQHSGNRYMDLNIAGTTGVHPFKGAGGSDRSGQAILQPNDMKHQSGYYVFLQLRNWFRAYYEYKKLHKEDAANLRLVFKNFKDGEFLIVELLRFTTKRSAGRPNMYDYSMNFKVIGRVQQKPRQLSSLQQLDQALNGAFDKINTARGVFLRSQDILRQVEANLENTIIEPLRQVNLALKALIGIPTVASDMGNRLISQATTAAVAFAILTHIKNSKDQGAQGAGTASGSASSQIPNTTRTLNQGTGSRGGPFANVMLPSNLTNAVQTNPSSVVLSLNDALMNLPISLFPESATNQLVLDQQSAAAQPRSYFENIITNLLQVRDNAADKYNLSSDTYNSHFRRTVTATPEAGTLISDEQFQILGALNLAVKGIYGLLSTQVLFNETYAERIATVQTEFDNRLNIKASQAVREIRLPANITLERLAQHELGDWSRWPEIVELNDLKPPYIIQDQTDTTQNIKHPGDRLLLPTPVVNGFGDVSTLRELPINQGLSSAERNLGIDLAVTKDFDLLITNSNDIQVVKGAQNAAQAILLKLFYERGDLLNHPEIGIGVNVGSKGDPVSEIKSQIISSLTADPRFSSIKNLSLSRTGGTLKIEFQAFMKNIDVPVPISLSL